MENSEIDRINNNNNANKITKKDMIQIACLFIIFAITMYFTIFEITIIVTGSMEPTVMTNDIGIVCKCTYYHSNPKRGDIISFYSEENQLHLLKRVIGLPGDTIAFKAGYVYINGIQLNESDYIPYGTRTICNKIFVVPNDSYFVMGDNRMNSCDSRDWDNPYVPKEIITGKLIFHTDLLTPFVLIVDELNS